MRTWHKLLLAGLGLAATGPFVLSTRGDGLAVSRDGDSTIAISGGTFSTWRGQWLVSHGSSGPEGACHASVDGTLWEQHRDEGDGYRATLEAEWLRSRLVWRSGWRSVLDHGAAVRTRSARVDYSAEGEKTYRFHVTCYHTAGPWRGLVKIEIENDGVQQWWKDRDGRPLLDDERPDRPCALDDPNMLPEAELEKYAGEAYLAYDANGRCTDHVYLRTEPPDWVGRGNRRVKTVYWDRPGAVWRNQVGEPVVWGRREYVQTTDANGILLPTSVRRVRFCPPGAAVWAVFEVTQQMDYAARPRPTIQKYSILYSDPGREDRILSAGKDCQVEIEDVTTGDPALQGQWVKLVTTDEHPATPRPAPRKPTPR